MRKDEIPITNSVVKSITVKQVTDLKQVQTDSTALLHSKQISQNKIFTCKQPKGTVYEIQV